MKLIVGEVLYIQAYAMPFLTHNSSVVPVAIGMAFFDKYGGVAPKGPEESVQFKYSFDDPDIVEYVRNCPYLLDFEEYAKLSTKELKRKQEQLWVDTQRKSTAFDGMSSEYQKNHQKELQESVDKAKLMSESYRLLIACKQGKIAMPTPPEGADPELFVREPKPFNRIINFFFR